MIGMDVVVILVAILVATAIAFLYFGCGGVLTEDACTGGGQAVASFIEGPLMVLSGALLVVSLIIAVLSMVVFVLGRSTVSYETKIVLLASLAGSALTAVLSGQAFHYFLTVS